MLTTASDLAFATDEGAGARAALGLIVLKSDETIEAEFRRIFDLPGVALCHSRIESAPDVTPQTLARMEHGLAGAVSLLPDEMDFSVIGYGCTSGATVIGEAKVETLVNSVRPGVAVTSPITALKAACRALGVRRLALLTPYVAEVSAAIRTHLSANHLEIAGFGSFGQAEEAIVARISTASTLAALKTVAQMAPCDAIFASCTNLRVLDVIEPAERELGIPVLSSNQVLAWHMLRLAGINDPIGGAGRLMRHGISKSAG